MATLDAFRQIASAQPLQTRVVESGGHLDAPSTHWRGQLVSAFTSQATHDQQNQQTVDAFRAAITQRYGANVSNDVFHQHLQVVRQQSQPLTPQLIHATLNAATNLSQQEQQLNDLAQQITRDCGAAVSKATIDQFRAGPNFQAGQPLSMQQLISLEQQATQTAQTQRAAAQQTVQPLAAASALARQGSAALDARVAAALLHVQPNCQERMAIYQAVLESTLVQLDASLHAVDQNQGPPSLLAKVAQQFADKLDAVVLNSVVQHAKDQGELPANGGPQAGSYTAMMQGLNQNGGGLTELCARYPACLDQLTTLGAQLSRSVGEIATRFATDMVQQQNGSDVGSRFGGAVANGLTNIRLTDSDPHKGGHRVAILTMHTHNGETLVVYKPRDVRIDAKLVGRNNEANVGQSLAEYTGQLLAHNPQQGPALPTYQFQAKVDPHGDHYGYVQCLSNGTPADQLLNTAEARDYYRNFGRQVAMLSFAGARDLHHTNVMVSGKQPCFTDLELSFEPDVFRMLEPSGDPGAAARRMQVGMALLSNKQLEWQPQAEVVNDHLTPQSSQVPQPVAENFIHVVGNLPNGQAIDGNNRSDAHAVSAFALDFQTGFDEVIAAFSAESQRQGGPQAFNQLIDGFQTMQARYHPVGTPEHLGIVKGGRDLSAPGMPPADFANGLGNIANRVLGSKVQGQSAKPLNYQEPVTQLAPFHSQDWAIGDVPYFVRTLGTNQCLHNAQTPVTNAQGGNYFGVDPLQLSKNMFGRLAQQPAQGPSQQQMLTQMGQNLADGMLNFRAPTPTGQMSTQDRQFYEGIVGPQPGVH